jgi:hypothetical protein
MRFDVKELAEIRATALETYSSIIRRVTLSRVDDGQGGVASEAELVSAEYPCRIAPLTGFERMAEPRTDGKKRFKVFTVTEFEAADGDLVRVDGTDYKIEELDPHSSQDRVQGVYIVCRVS